MRIIKLPRRNDLSEVCRQYCNPSQSGILPSPRSASFTVFLNMSLRCRDYNQTQRELVPGLTYVASFPVEMSDLFRIETRGSDSELRLRRTVGGTSSQLLLRTKNICAHSLRFQRRTFPESFRRVEVDLREVVTSLNSASDASTLEASSRLHI